MIELPQKPTLPIHGVSGSISIYDYKPRQGCKEIIINSKWANDAEYFIVRNNVDCLVIQKCYMEIPKNALKISKQNHLRIEIEVPNGTFAIDEESTEDELVVYYR
jgi:NAD-dependent dihydropyrimidine dehydrogenase PreA subunit